MRPSVLKTGANRNRCNHAFSLQNRVHWFAGGKVYALAAATSDRAGNLTTPSVPT